MRGGANDRLALIAFGQGGRYAMPRDRPKPIGLGQPENPNLASQMRIAFSSMAWNTGSRSPGELEMTCSTSEVAVCCCSNSRDSLSRRVFSMAMTAWRAKFWTSSICFSVKGRTSWR